MKWFYNLKIASKITSVAVLLALVAGVVGYVGITQLRSVRQADATMYETNLVPISNLGKALESYQKLRVSVRDMVLADSSEDRAKKANAGRACIKDLRAFLKDYERIPIEQEEKEVFKTLSTAVDNYAEDFEVFGKLLDQNKKAEALTYMKGPFLVVANTGLQALDKLTKTNEKHAKASVDANGVSADRGTQLMLIIIAIGMGAAIGLGLWLSRLISKPLKKVVERAEQLQNTCIANLGMASDAMAHGKLDIEVSNEIEPLNIDLKDEVGDLANSVNGMITKTQEATFTFMMGTGALRKVMEEIHSLIQSAQAGDLAKRGNAEGFEGGYREMVAGFNATLDAVVNPLRMASTYIDRISKGDLPSRITETYNGDFNDIKNSLNLCIDTLRGLIEEDGGASLLAAANKDLTARAKREYHGAFEKMKGNINTLIQNLDEALSQVALAAEQVSSASTEISSGSQTLSQGASEQASSLEEVSSSLQEMSSMTKRNAENAKEAQSLSEGAQETANKGVESMKRLSEAIDRIKTSSDSTARIVKTIDEIAFQTNLLALNAAVEAARAGDAGKGFAVVAEEVRNLAMRSAEAAKNTANMIEESVKNAEGGVAINQEVLRNLTEINSQVNKVSAVMAEIAAASEQQSQGVEQVNTAVEQMNQVTQQVAANAEESASAAEELSGQSEEMKGMVGAFQLSSSGTISGRHDRRARRSALPAPKVQVPKKSAFRPNGGLPAPVAASNLIPFDGDEQSILDEF
jgi:methyl-accepting chemotaxis protein